MMEYAPELINYGALGILSLLLVVGVRTLYRRNCEHTDTIVKLNEKSVEVIAKNTEAMYQHTETIRDLKELLGKKL